MDQAARANARTARRAVQNYNPTLRGTIPDEATIDGVSVSNYGGQRNGIAYEVKANEIMQQALTTPGLYLTNRITALQNLDRQVSELFEQKYETFVQRGLKPQDAKDKAEAWAKLYTDAGMSDIDSQYPANVTETAANLTYKNTTASKIGFK